MARPRVNPDDKIKIVIPVKFSSNDRLRLKDKSKKEHIPLSTYIRKIVLEKLNGEK